MISEGMVSFIAPWWDFVELYIKCYKNEGTILYNVKFLCFYVFTFVLYLQDVDISVQKCDDCIIAVVHFVTFTHLIAIFN